MKLAIVIPAYNEETTVGKVLESIPKTILGINKIITIVIDDGSTDATYFRAKEKSSCTVRHSINLGVGAATITGIEMAKKLGSNIVATMDADGQHNPLDLPKLINPILESKADIVIGSRMFNVKGMPALKICGNWIMNFVTLIVFRRWVTDSQSGMKAFSEKALKKMKLHSIGYEVCSEIIGDAKEKNLKLIEVPIETIYSEYSKIKGQNIINAVNIFTRILFFKVTGRK